MTDFEAGLRQALAPPPRSPDGEFTAAVEKRVRAATRFRAILLALITTVAVALVLGLLAGVVMMGPAWTSLFSVAWIPPALAPAHVLTPVALCFFSVLLLAPLLRPSE